MPRKGENIYKRKDGRWEGRVIEHRDISGKASYRSYYANSYLELKEKMRTDRFREPGESANSGRKLSEYADEWLCTVKLKCKISTYNKYKSICGNHILPALGAYPAESVTVRQIENFIYEKSYLSPKTRNDILSVLKMILLFADRDGCRVANIRNLSVKQEHKQTRVLSAEEQKTLTAFLLSDSDLCKTGIYLSLCTGIRIGELCALQRKNISFENSLLTMTATMQRVQIDGDKGKTQVITAEPKSKNSVRDIPLTETVCGILKKNYSALPEDAYLLSGRVDKFIEPRLLEYRFRSYTNECGLENVNFHALRHTFATRCVENGFEIKTLSEILGHVNVNITLNRYVHSSMDMKRFNMEKLINVF